MKPEEFLFKQKGSLFKGIVESERGYKNRKRGVIYLSNTQLMIVFKKGGECIIPLNTIKSMILFRATGNRPNDRRFSIRTHTDESYVFFTNNIRKTYRRLCEVLNNLPNGRTFIPPRHRQGLELSFETIVKKLILIIASLAIIGFLAGLYWFFNVVNNETVKLIVANIVVVIGIIAVIIIIIKWGN